jgi:MFS family permease
MALSTSQVCGIKISTALAAFILEVATGLLFILIASTHVKHRKVERALSIKLVLLAITGFTIWLGIGSIGSAMSFVWRPATAKDMTNIVYIVSCILLPFFCLMPSVMATGELQMPRKPIIDALSGRFIFKTDMRGAIPFMALWSSFAYAAFMGTLYWLSKVQSIPANKGFWPMCLYIGIATVCVAVGISSMGILASSISKKRKSAAGLVIFFVLILFAGYGFVFAYYESTYTHHTNSIIYQTAALWPLTPIIGQIDWTRNMPKLWWNPHNSWIVTSAAYMLISAICLGLAGPALKKSGGVKEDFGDS